MTNTCRQVIKMIAEKNKKSLITPPSVKACVIIMIIGIGISTWGFLENQREIKEDIIVGLQRLNLRDRTSIEQLENEIKQYQIKQEKASKGLTKGCVAILSTGISIFLGEIFWIFNY